MVLTHKGRVALITGASSGLGAEFARLLAAAGVKVALGARRTDKLAALVAEIEAAGGEALAVSLDVRDESSIIAAYDATEARFGLVDTILANAGINADGSATELSIEDFDNIQAVNSRGVFLTAREGGRRLLASGQPKRGRVLILASMGGIHALSGLVAYCASKASAVMIGRGLASEWSRAGICVNVLCPGYMLTELNDDWFTSPAGERMIQKMPRKRLMPVDALNPVVAHLTSDEASYVTGTVVQITDGQVI